MATILERIKVAYDVYRHGFPMQRKGEITERKSAPFIVFPDYGSGVAQWKMSDLQTYIDEGFNVNALIYSAIMYKARSVAQAPLRAYKGGQDQPELLPESHPLAKLVYRPNKSQSWREFQMMQTIFLNLAGEAFTWFDRKKSAGGVPSAMYSLNPQNVYILKGKVQGYVYKTPSQRLDEGIPLLTEDVSHVKLPNPGDPLEGDGYGLSPMSPMAQSGDVDNIITKFLLMFFQTGAIPPGVLKFSDSIDPKIADEIKARWREQHGGYENWADVGIMDKGGEFQRVGFTFDELGFDGQDARNESRIVMPFGVPLILIGSRLGLERSTYSNYREARTAFWEDTMVSELMLFEDDYKYYMQSDDGGFVAFDLSQVPALRKDTPALVTAWATLVDRGVAKDTATKEVGLTLPELPDGKVIYMPMNMIPMGAGDQTQESSAEQPNAEEDANKTLKELALELKLAREALQAEPAEVKRNGHKKAEKVEE